MPFGLLNEHHEPTNFYGVQRNFVETLIIPSTWREGGFNFHGDTAVGLWLERRAHDRHQPLRSGTSRPNSRCTRTALELENNGSAPLQATHQELALANAHHLSQYVALSYFGVPGLDVGGAISTGKAAAAAPPTRHCRQPRVTLWEGHARWTPGRFDLSALYAHGTISNLAERQCLESRARRIRSRRRSTATTCRAPTSCGSTATTAVNPFVRWEHYNMGASYRGHGRA